MAMDIKKLGEGVGNAITSGGLGIILGEYNDKRQADQQRRLQELQIKGQKEMTDYNKESQMDIWNRTNYEAQMGHIKNAGLNPALMYGSAGAGGTTGSGGGGAVTGATATQGGGGEFGMGMQMKSQMELMQAQKENIEADTANKLANVPVNKATEENLGANTNLTNMKAEAQSIENKFQQWRNNDDGMASPAQRELMLEIQKQHAVIRNMEQEFKNMGVDFNNIEASTNNIKSRTDLQEQLRKYLENANPVQLELLKTASKMTTKQLERFMNDPKNTKTGMYVDYGMDKLKDVVDMGTDIYGAKTFRQLLEKEPKEQNTTIEETIAHPNGTTTERYRRENRR